MNDQELEKLGFQSFDQYNFPNIVNLYVVSGKCTCFCVHCPVGVTPTKDRSSKFAVNEISLDLFEKIVKEISIYPHSTLRIHGVGEPLLWRNLIQGLIIGKRHHVRTWIFTSLVSKNRRFIQAIAEYCDIIEVSINSYEGTDYFETKGVDRFQLVCENVKLINDEISTKKLNTRLIVNRVESTDRKTDDAFIKYWKNTGWVDDAFIRTFSDFGAELENPLRGKPTVVKPCMNHWSRFHINYDGVVVVCFSDLFKGKEPHPNVVLGDVSCNSIKSVWQGQRLNIIRKAQLSSNYMTDSFLKDLSCFGCTSGSIHHKWKKSETSECQIKAASNNTVFTEYIID